MKIADKKMVENFLGLLEEQQFQSNLDTVMDCINRNALVIAKRYNDLMDVARNDFAVAEKTLVAKIVTTIYKESQKVQKQYEQSERIHPEQLSNIISINIQKWKELKTYGELIGMMNYGISLEHRLNDSLGKYHLYPRIHADYFIPYMGNGTMYIHYKVTDEQKVLIEPKEKEE